MTNIKYDIIGNDFDKALNTNLRFEYNGLISTEDLYQLNLDQLNTLYQKYQQIINNEETPSLLKTENNDSENKLRLRIIKHIFDAKQLTLNEQNTLKTKEESKQKILQAIKHKQEEELSNKSVDELLEMINDL